MISCSATDPLDLLLPQLEKAGYKSISPAFLQPAAPFLDLSGEELRKRMYLTQDNEGNELCLRPDLTIPTALLHIETAGLFPACYSYLGPVFRAETNGRNERLQGGFESFGHADRAVADAETLATALESVQLWDINSPHIRLGDLELVDAFLSALQLTPAWKRKLRRSAARERGLDADLRALATPANGASAERTAFLATLDGADSHAAKSVVEDLLSIAGISQVGGRVAGDIAERLLEQARLNAGAHVPEAAHEALQRFFAISGPLPEAFTALQKLAQERKLDLSAALEAFAERLRAFKTAGLDSRDITFATRFGRRLDYYTGFVFELHTAGDVLAGGGRYDTLLSTLGVQTPVPAVGCAIWIDRLREIAP
jgi:ATP phosphoribosyltransferase regulatory subunit